MDQEATKKTSKKTAKKSTKKVAKKVTKKAPSKKVAKNSSTTSEASNSLFNPLGGDASYVEEAKRVLLASRERRKNRSFGFGTMSEVRQGMLSLNEFSLQWALSSYGIPHGSLIEIIGSEHLGKTSLSFKLMGNALLSGAPCLYIETEGKQLQPNRVRRMLSQNKEMADLMMSRIFRDEARSLMEMEEVLTEWVYYNRSVDKFSKNGLGVPHSTPLVAVVDSWSKLMNEAEAAGFYDWGDNMNDANKKKKKGTNEASNLIHSKWAHAWCRRLPHLLHGHNLILILIQHQNMDINMQAAAGKSAPALPASVGNLYNKKKLGGKAFDQNSAIQFIMAKSGVVKNSEKRPIGTNVTVRVEKNSYGPAGRKVDYQLINEHTKDTDLFLEPGIQFHQWFAKWVADNRYFGTSVNLNRFTCDRVDAFNLSPFQFAERFQTNTKIINELGCLLNIDGYSRDVDDIKEELKHASDDGQPVHSEHTEVGSEDEADAELESE